MCKSDVRGNLETKSHAVILEVGYAANWGCLPPAVEVGCGEALPLYNLQHLWPFGPQGCALFPREICSQGTIVKAPWKSTQPFPSRYPVLLAHRVVLIFWNAKHNREGTQHKSQGQIMQSPPRNNQTQNLLCLLGRAFLNAQSCHCACLILETLSQTTLGFCDWEMLVLRLGVLCRPR